MMGLDEHTVVVTGASRGIGAMISQRLAAEGARVALIARTERDIVALSDTLRAEGAKTVAVTCDVTSEASIESALDRVRSEFGRVTAVVNNAGVIEPIGRLSETDASAWLAGVATNLGGAYLMTRAVLADLTASRNGVVVNLSSGAADRPLEGWSAYCVAKAGVAMLTRMTDHEYGGSGLAVYGLRPGLVDTAMQSAIRESGIGPVASVPRKNLLAPSIPARLAAWLIRERPTRWRGQEVDVRDEEVRQASALDSGEG